MHANNTGDWIRSIAKAELHVHLEGSIPPEALWELVRKYGGSPDAPDLASLSARFRYKDFPHFIETWIWKNGFLREYDDFTFIAEAMARDFVRQNIRYAEVHFSPPEFAGVGLCIREITSAVRAGLSRVTGVEVWLIADLVRDLGPERAARTLEELREVRDLGVVGIGLGGSEQKHPAELFTVAFERARSMGLHTTAHAGEAAGAQSVRAAVELLRAERIGHATRAVEDLSVVNLLARRRIPVEACPISNMRTGVISRLEDHPIRLYVERGIPVTVNTDDPAMFETSLAGEYLALEQRLGFSRKELLALVRNGFECSWASPQRKAELLAGLED
jgi:adenosine deaminase